MNNQFNHLLSYSSECSVVNMSILSRIGFVFKYCTQLFEKKKKTTLQSGRPTSHYFEWNHRFSNNIVKRLHFLSLFDYYSPFQILNSFHVSCKIGVSAYLLPAKSVSCQVSFFDHLVILLSMSNTQWVDRVGGGLLYFLHLMDGHALSTNLSKMKLYTFFLS